ncbi:glucoamylase family protein [Oleiagrimonas sp. C23AA]|uniref:glucoamylase family protein n=1 Tax=Oleiagrimonas sp. C23AA TaxID=2719047 RepID=UPI001F0E86A8|nr:glucoamylase family protein [Oleiagrimonas sp. C23AA]
MMPAIHNLDEALLDALQAHALRYLLDEVDPHTGLVADSTIPGTVCSIAAVGMALASYPLAVEHRLITRNKAATRTLRLLRLFHDAPQGEAVNATGYRGFYYHFLDMQTGRRAWESELSTIDTALLLVGALTAAAFFGTGTEDEREINALADALYRRADWQWALDGGLTLTHGWRPESGFLPYRWQGYDEALILYVLALGSTTHPIPADSYAAWATSYTWKRIYDHELLYAGPLFIHQYSHLWIDFRGIRDAYMRDKDSDYFENSRRATLVQREYAIRNPLGFAEYGDCCWGFTACHGPGPATLHVDGVERRFLGYSARGAPHGPDDGTITTWAVAASLPFAPEVVLPTLRHFAELHVGATGRYGFESTFNPSYPSADGQQPGWVCPWIYGIDQGALGLMIENYRTGAIWERLKRSPWIVRGLLRAGFDGGWLGRSHAPGAAESAP